MLYRRCLPAETPLHDATTLICCSCTVPVLQRSMAVLAAGTSPRASTGGGIIMSAINALSMDPRVTDLAAKDPQAAVFTGTATLSLGHPVVEPFTANPNAAHPGSFAADAESAEAGSPLMRRSVEDSASLLSLVGVTALVGNDGLSIAAAAQEETDPPTGGDPALERPSAQPAPDHARAALDDRSEAGSSCTSPPPLSDKQLSLAAGTGIQVRLRVPRSPKCCLLRDAGPCGVSAQ